MTDQHNIPELDALANQKKEGHLCWGKNSCNVEFIITTLSTSLS